VVEVGAAVLAVAPLLLAKRLLRRQDSGGLYRS